MTYCSRFDTLDNLIWVNGLCKDLVYAVTESIVVNEATCILAAVLLNQLLHFLLSHSNTESTDASSELNTHK